MTGEASSQRGRRLVPLLVAATGLLLVVVFRGPLRVWFAGGAAPRSPVSRAEVAEPARAVLGDEARARVEAALASADQIREQLARDHLDGVAEQARPLVAALDDAQGAVSEGSTPVASALADARDAAVALERATDLAQARASFAELSRSLIAAAETDPRLTRGWHLFSCPMTPGFDKWFQRSAERENPYMGETMLTCGSPAEWSTPARRGESSAVGSGSGGSHGHGEVAYYTCSMHPSVREQAPGRCPICGMKLVPVTREQLETGTIVVDEGRRQRIGVRTEPVARRELTLTIRAVGEVKVDENRLAEVNLRMGGWVTRLSAAETGQRVRRGQVLFRLYSPELYAAEQEYLSAWRRGKESTSPAFGDIARAARRRLILLGMSGAQIEALERRGKAEESVAITSPSRGYILEKNIVEGARIEAGTRVYRIADLGRIWIDAEVYEDDLARVRLGQKAEITIPYAPGTTYEGRIDYVYPTLQTATRTGRIRIVLDNPDLTLKPEMYADVGIAVDLGERLAIPESAVIYTGPRHLVFVDEGEGRLRPMEVELGAHAGGYYEVESGLSAGEVVVTAGNFLIAAESRIRSAAGTWEAGDARE